jgi:putative transposase
MPYWKLYYHFIWGTRERLPVILPAFESDLYRTIAAKVKELDGTTYAIGGIMDHVHLAVSVPPMIAVAKFVGEIKGNSSHFINNILKPGFEFYWQAEYGVLSFGEKNLPALVRYIQNQKRHHANGSLIAVMELI